MEIKWAAWTAMSLLICLTSACGGSELPEDLPEAEPFIYVTRSDDGDFTRHEHFSVGRYVNEDVVSILSNERLSGGGAQVGLKLVFSGYAGPGEYIIDNSFDDGKVELYRGTVWFTNEADQGADRDPAKEASLGCTVTITEGPATLGQGAKISGTFVCSVAGLELLAGAYRARYLSISDGTFTAILDS